MNHFAFLNSISTKSITIDWLIKSVASGYQIHVWHNRMVRMTTMRERSTQKWCNDSMFNNNVIQNELETWIWLCGECFLHVHGEQHNVNYLKLNPTKLVCLLFNQTILTKEWRLLTSAHHYVKSHTVPTPYEWDLSRPMPTFHTIPKIEVILRSQAQSETRALSYIYEVPLISLYKPSVI